MRTHIETPNSIQSDNERAINQLASIGFGQEEAVMLSDTKKHIRTADYIQQAHSNNELVGFALYRRQLWRQGN